MGGLATIELPIYTTYPIFCNPRLPNMRHCDNMNIGIAISQK